MANAFGATSTAEEVLSCINLKGKRILVTGVSAGIGVETARSLAPDFPVDPLRGTAGERVFVRSPFLQRRPRRSQLCADAL
jgi:hypothetical protein